MWQEVLDELMPYEANGLRFRKTDARDVDVHLLLYNDPKVRQFVGPPLNLSREQALKDVTTRSMGMAGIYVVEDAGTGISIGESGFIGSNYISETDMSIMLLAQHHGCGYGRRILRSLYSLWVDQLGHETCFATFWQANVAARSILESEGFVQVDEYIDVRVDEPCLVFARGRMPAHERGI
jgi:GNAT superfamily N-acetyltransferase